MPISDFLPRTGEQRAPRELPPVSAFAGDDGTCPPELAAALAVPVDQADPEADAGAGPGAGPEAGAVAGSKRLRAVVAALASARVLVPVVAHEETAHDGDVRERLTGHRERRTYSRPGVPTGSGADQDAAHDGGAHHRHDAHPGAGHEHGVAHDGGRHASASMVTVRTPDGREALPVFSSVAALTAWRRDARPVPHQAVRAAMAAVDEAGGVLVLDAGSPAPVLIPRPAVWALARREAWVPALADPTVVRELVDTVRGVDGVRSAAVAPGARAEVKVSLAVVPGLSREQVQGVAQAVAAALGESAVVAERVDSLELALTSA
ncbi:SseB family protein [Miniimonas sp. S16]|uniref:SseB family protein n=1 Tax=Miniimonas sp. S16 TaxID=2171623 RepID=UPI001900DF55|nr:SseB family protein [Miniimonas sp. S16]